MWGRVNEEDAEGLVAGRRCIIEELDRPGQLKIWWGRVVESASGRRVQAVIQGGPFNYNPVTGAVIETGERRGERLNSNYHVYPDTTTTRSLFHRLQLAQAGGAADSHGSIGTGYASMT